MKAAVLDKPFSIEVRDVLIPEPKRNEALVKVYCIGVCGSDVHYYEHGKIGRYEVREPIILGHELAGEVVKVGEEVTEVSVGDRVAVEPGVTCMKCKYCKQGRYNLCPDVVFMATPPVDGAWADYVTVRSDFLFKIPDEMTYEEGALLEPLSVGYHAMNRGNVKPSDILFITGLGPIGLLTVQAAKMFGVTKIYGSDIVPLRKQVAEQMGVTVIDPLKENVSEKLKEYTNGVGVDVIIETSGNSHVISNTIKQVNRGGRVVLIGLPTTTDIPIDIPHLIDSEIDVFGVFRYVNTYPALIQSLSRSKLDIEKIITHKYALTDIKEALEVARTQKDESIKVMIYPDGRNI